MSVTDDVATFFAAQEKTEPPVAISGRPFESLRVELRGYMAEMQSLCHQDPDEVMAWLSSVSARALEMRSFTLDSDSRAATKFRIEELIPFTEACQFQFQVASRRFSILEQEWKLVRGQPT